MSDRLPAHISLMRRCMRLMRHSYVPLAFAPMIMWGAYHMWGETGLIGGTVIVTLYLLVLAIMGNSGGTARSRDLVTGLELREELYQRTEETIGFCEQTGRTTAGFVIEIDSFSELSERYGQSACDRIMETIADRIMITMRADDVVARVGDSRIAITLHPVKRIDLELALQIAARLQTNLEDPIAINASSAYITVSIGLCTLTRAKNATARGLLEGATTALIEARRNGPSAIRSFSSEMKRIEVARKALIQEAVGAFERGEICAWFQPQISTDTGQVSGIEALARWIHPQRGMIAPGEFLPALEQAGFMDHLNETMLTQSLEAVRSLDLDGVHIPVVGVNFAAEELRNPKLLDRVKWQLDRFELSPDRLAVEILESVVAGAPDDILVRNIAGLADLGCHIDLDDFGTGHASITSLRRFPIDRLKIDRSFVTKCDTDPDQQRMLTAILTMAERLELSTLAEGLESVGEHALVSQLGVDHVQGFGIARPMPRDMLAEWIEAHEAKLAHPPVIGGKTA
ncbi:putative bifunctional diguanylate cyclase/phosphodiesterase [Primorskyibacter sp. S187A]|uniref:putative bifunctional diguanylate cyclase/phosphodiesterase n=1 Tax=Primorskyibacter sp. S187A TaxID=3415130 RepID=UPI003C7AA9B3